MFCVCFLVQSVFVSSSLEIPFRRGCLISAVMIGVGIGVVIVAGLIGLALKVIFF